MVYLIISILSSTAIFISFKLFERYRIDNLQAIVFNYVIAAGFGFLIYESEFSFQTLHQNSWFPNAIIIGIAFIVAFNIFALSTQKVGISITAVSSKMSVVIPIVFAVILYHDKMNLLKAVGIIIAFFAFYLTFKQNIQLKLHRRFIILPVLLFISNGTIDTLLKLTEHRHINDDLILFLSMIFLVALGAGLLVLLVNYFFVKKKIHFRNIIAGTILGLLNFSATYYFLKALGIFQSSVVFPILNVGIVALSALTAFFIFKEKLALINWIGIFLAIIAILAIAYA
ncbi:MAG: EamA family transporter [Bacteroidales bacterium]|nr:EamA family transporter [Bacteroidales bacterium]